MVGSPSMLAWRNAQVTSWMATQRGRPVAALLKRHRIAHSGGVPACVSPRASCATSVAQNRDFTSEPFMRSTHLVRTSLPSRQSSGQT